MEIKAKPVSADLRFAKIEGSEMFTNTGKRTHWSIWLLAIGLLGLGACSAFLWANNQKNKDSRRKPDVS